jgi:hypothetical protein
VYNRDRKAGSPLLATLILLVLAIIFAGIVIFWNTVGFSDSQPVYKMEIPAVYFVSPISVKNARWQIATIIQNKGTEESTVSNVFVNGENIEERGLIHGDSLSNTSSLAMSIPENGLSIPPGKSSTFYIWIGGDKFSSGTVINIVLQGSNQIELKKTTTLG